MQLLICVCIAWITIILFSLMPKRLFIVDHVFLYCILLILTSTMYTILELNFHMIKKPMSGTDLWAATVFRVITLPILILIAMNALHKLDRSLTRWIIPLAIWIGLTMHDWILYRFNVIQYTFSHALLLLGVEYLGLILMMWSLAWGYKRLDRGKVG